MTATMITQDMTGDTQHLIVPILTLLFIIAALTHQTDAGYDYLQISDERLKTDITPAGQTDTGLNLYSYRYIWSDEIHTGVMAQEVLTHTPEAVVTLPGGFYAVDYSQLGLQN